MCFMTIENEVNSNDKCLYDDFSTFDDEIFDNFEKLALNHSIMKKKLFLLKNQVIFFLKTAKRS